MIRRENCDKGEVNEGNGLKAPAGMTRRDAARPHFRALIDADEGLSAGDLGFVLRPEILAHGGS